MHSTYNITQVTLFSTKMFANAFDPLLIQLMHEPVVLLEDDVVDKRWSVG